MARVARLFARARRARSCRRARGRPFDPESLPLERIRGQHHAAATRIGVNALPIDMQSGLIQLGEGLNERETLIGPRAQACQPAARRLESRIVAEQSPRQLEQRAPGTDLEETIAGFGQRAGAFGKADRLEQLST